MTTIEEGDYLMRRGYNLVYDTYLNLRKLSEHILTKNWIHI